VRILVVEDNLINQKVIRIILEQNSLIYDIANDGLEAVSKYQGSKYDLILMDCQMPNLDGLQATQQIREYETKINKDRCPIVALTANAMSGDEDKCKAAGMDGFLSKPFKSQDLSNIIKKWGKL